MTTANRPSPDEPVRALYRAYPYPNGPHQIRADSFAELLLSYVSDAPSKPLRLLDAGCGTGAGLIPLAELHRDAKITAFDFSPESAAIARAAALERGLDHITVLDGDLLDAGFVGRLRAEASSGFDIIYCSGVLHHISDATRALAALRELLAPSGVLSLMVYGYYGRLPVTRLAQSIEALLPPHTGTLQERLAASQPVFEALIRANSPVARGQWADLQALSEPEAADRYLHPLARAYTVPALIQWLESSGLKPLRWLEPRDWSAHYRFGPGPVAEAIDAMPWPDQAAVMDRLFDHPSLEILAVHPSAQPRQPVPTDALADTVVELNPQAAVVVVERRYGDDGWAEEVGIRLRNGPVEPITGAHAALARACDLRQPARELIARAQDLLPLDESVYSAALEDLLAAEILYPPHP